MSKSGKMIPTKMKNGIAKRGQTFSYVVRVPDTLTGKTKPRWVGGFKSVKEAKTARDKDRVAMSSGTFVNPSKMRMDDFLGAWIDTHGHNLKPSTESSYRGHIRLYLNPSIGSILVSDLRASHIQKMYVDLKKHGGTSGSELSGRTVQFTSAILGKALKHAVDVEGLISSNPSSKVPRPRNSPKTNQPYSPEQVKLIMEKLCQHRLMPLFRLATHSGARLGELLALTWSDVDFNAGTIVFSKNRLVVDRKSITQDSTKGGEGRRLITVDQTTLEVLKGHKHQQNVERLISGEEWFGSDNLFLNESGRPIDHGTPSKIFQKHRKELKLPTQRFHDLRHFHATQLLEAGIPLHVVAQRLGHRDPMVTATIYAHVTNQQAENVSEVFAKAVQR